MMETVREMTFEEEAVLYEKEARAEFAKENGVSDSEGVNNILRRGMRIIRKARELIGDKKPMTNGDYLRSLDDEDLAVALDAMVRGLLAGLEMHTAVEKDYRDIFLYFLKRPAEKS